MKSTPAIEVANVSKVFRLPHERYNSLKHRAIHLFSTRHYTQHVAVKDVTFTVNEGEFFGIVGRNGSGKSTLLKMLAGIYTPTRGEITIHGSLSPFIELGVGFNPELTARENVFLNGAILGLSRKQIEASFDDIIGFGELEDFVDQKLKNFSSGMQVRLAFSIAIQAQSSILLIDEVLAVGDANFQAKCFRVFRDLKRKGKTIVFVSHDMSTVREFCDRVIMIEDGQLTASGNTEEVISRYIQANLEQAERATDQTHGKLRRWGTGEATIEKIRSSYSGNPKTFFSNEPQIEFDYDIKIHETLEKPVVGLIIKNAEGHILLAGNTKVNRDQTGTWHKGSGVKVKCRVDNVFGNGSYTVSPAVATSDTKSFYDWVDDAITFEVRGREMAGGTIVVGNSFEVDAS